MGDPANGAASASGATDGEAPRAGMAVYDAHGERLGGVERAESGAGYITVKAGSIFSRTLYIPLDAIAREDDDGMHLKVAKADLNQLDWYLPPTDGVDLDTPYSASPWIETGYGQGERPTPPGERARKLERDEQAGIQPPPRPGSPAKPPAHETTDTLPRALAPDAAWAGNGAYEDTRGETTIAVPLAEEHLEARTTRHTAGAGTAHVRKVVSRERRSLEVPLTHDELRVERVHVAHTAAVAGTRWPDAFTEKDIDVPLMGEQVELEKRLRVTEEVVLRKRQVTEQRTYTGEVRKERVWVEGTNGREIAADSDDVADTRNAGLRDISEEDTITYDRLAQDQV